jgi:hypothetical protein
MSGASIRGVVFPARSKAHGVTGMLTSVLQARDTAIAIAFVGALTSSSDKPWRTQMSRAESTLL